MNVGPMDELDPGSTVDDRGVVVVNYNSGGIERGGSHRPWPEGERGEDGMGI